jgi:drug/metabolite transporter (DMT)-like permease
MTAERTRSRRLGKGEIWALVAAVGYALNHVLLNVALAGYELDNMVAATVQAFPALLAAAILGWGIRGKDGRVSPLADWKLAGAAVLGGLLLLVVGAPLLFGAFRKGGVLITSPVTGTSVLWGALLAAALLHEPFNRRMAAGMGISILGIAVLSLGKGGAEQLSPTWWLAVPYALGAALCWAISGVLLAYAMRRGVDRYQALGLTILVGVLILNVYMAITGRLRLYGDTPLRVLRNTLWAGVFNSIGVVAITTAFSMTSVASASTLNNLQVGLAPLLAWAFLGEWVSLVMAGGLVLILVGVIVVQRSKAPLSQVARVV